MNLMKVDTLETFITESFFFWSFFYNHYRIHVFMNQAIEKSDFVLNDILKKLRIKTLKHNKACC